jgi:hypothetical protein
MSSSSRLLRDFCGISRKWWWKLLSANELEITGEKAVGGRIPRRSFSQGKQVGPHLRGGRSRRAARRSAPTSYAPARTDFQFLAQVTNPQVFVIASLASVNHTIWKQNGLTVTLYDVPLWDFSRWELPWLRRDEKHNK